MLNYKTLLIIWGILLSILLVPGKPACAFEASIINSEVLPSQLSIGGDLFTTACNFGINNAAIGVKVFNHIYGDICIWGYKGKENIKVTMTDPNLISYSFIIHRSKYVTDNGSISFSVRFLGQQTGTWKMTIDDENFDAYEFELKEPQRPEISIVDDGGHDSMLDVGYQRECLKLNFADDVSIWAVGLPPGMNVKVGVYFAERAYSAIKMLEYDTWSDKNGRLRVILNQYTDPADLLNLPTGTVGRYYVVVPINDGYVPMLSAFDQNGAVACFKL